MSQNCGVVSRKESGYANTMDMTPPPPMPNAGTPPKKGLHPLAWVGMGCGGLLVVAIIGIIFAVNWGKKKFDEFAAEMTANPQRAVAESILKFHPELEEVSHDDTAGTITVRVKSTGEEMTVSYDDLANGRLTITQPDGSTTSLGASDPSAVPTWVPVYPAIKETQSNFHQESPEKIHGVMSFTTNDTPEAVAKFFEDEVDRWPGSATVKTSGSMNLGSTSQLTRTLQKDGRKIELTISSAGSGSPTQTLLIYEETLKP